MAITNSTQNVLMYGFNGTNPDRVEINGSGHLKCNVENSLTIASMPPVSTDISGQYVNVANNTDPATGTKQDTQIAQTLVKDGFSQVLLTSAGGTLVKADTTALVQNDPENREGWNIVNNVAGTKFNFYFFGGANEVITLGQVQSVYWKGFVNVNTEFSSMPFIHIYTKPTGSGDAGAFYHSKITYEYNNDNTIGIGEECVFYGKATPSTPFNNRKVALNNVITEGDGGDAEEVLYMVVASNSTATQDAVNNTINLMGFNTALVKRNLVLATETTSGSVSVSNFPATQDVSGSVSVSNFPATQTVDGTVDVGNFPATQDVSGSVVVSNNTDPATATLQTAGNASLSAIEASNYAEGDTIGVSDTGVLIMGRNGTNAAKPIHITNNGDVEVEIADFVKGQDTSANSFPVVLASDAVVSVVQADVIAQGSENNIENNASITAGALSSLSADITNMKTANILYEDSATSSFDGIRVEVSGDSGTNYHVVSELYPQTSGSIRFSYLTIDVGGLSNMRIRNNSSTDTYTNVECSVYGSA